MRTSSAKAKGRRLQQEVASALRATTGLSEADIKSTPMGTQGEDVWLSAAAREKFPYSIECKNVEKLNLWKAWAQAVSNQKDLHPMLVVARNRQEPLVVLRLADFLEEYAVNHGA